MDKHKDTLVEVAKLTSSGGADEGTEESTSRENGDNKRLVRGRNRVATLVINEIVGRETKRAEPILHFLNTADDTRIITEQDTTKRAES